VISIKSETRLPRFSVDWTLGALSAVPFAYPKEPFYWIILSIFFLGLCRFRVLRKDLQNLLLILLLILLVSLVNFFNGVYVVSIYATYLSLFLLLFRYIVENHEEYFLGFAFVTSIYAFATFAAFFVLRPYTNGLLMFINSEYRMWAEGYLIEWPNVFSAFLVIGAFIHFVFQNTKLASLHFAAAILTTSRTALLALIVLAFFYLHKGQSKVKYIYAILVISIFIATYIFFNSDDMFVSFIFDRLIKTGDRGEIYTKLIESSFNSLSGIGNVPFNDIDDMFDSYHSSYLKVLTRYGVLGLVLYTAITYPKGFFKHGFLEINLPILFIIICGIVQDFMFHMHIIAVYSVLLSYRETVLQRSD